MNHQVRREQTTVSGENKRKLFISDYSRGYVMLLWTQKVVLLARQGLSTNGRGENIESNVSAGFLLQLMTVTMATTEHLRGNIRTDGC